MRARSHRRFRRAVSGYADGELDRPAAQAVAIHLLECDRCRRELAMVEAIKGSLRRLAEAEPPTLAATRLRRWSGYQQEMSEVPSLGLRDRRGGVVEPTSVSPRGVRGVARLTGRHPFHTRVGALVGFVAAVVATGALFLHRPGPSPDPATVAALVELARLEPPAPLTAGKGERAGQPHGRILELGDRKVSLVRHVVDGREVLVATSDRPFPMPADARALSRERGAPWLARRGALSLACLSRPTHRLLVGPLPAERLVEIGRQLGPL